MKVHINLSELCTPDVHAVGCADQGRKAVKRRGYAGTYEAEVSSLLDIAVDYWSDFVNGKFDGRLDTEEEAAEEALGYLLAHEPRVYPCVTDHLPVR